jgi:hypothetical protein
MLPHELQKYAESDNTITEIDYPVLNYPDKIKSIGFDKMPTIKGVLTGIKGQYLIFNDDSVLNIRKHNGYYINLKQL